MRVTCERCDVTYDLRDDRVPPGGAQVQCTHCQHVFVARHPPVEDTIMLDRTERELLRSLIDDLALLRQRPQVQFLGDDGTEPTDPHAAVLPVTTGLHEIANVRQVPGDSPRRWFTSSDLDLIVWLGPHGHPWGFQLCYGKKEHERAVTWWPERGLTHSVVDEGRRDPLTVKGSPVLLSASGPLDVPTVRAEFEAASAELPATYREFVLQRLR